MKAATSTPEANGPVDTGSYTAAILNILEDSHTEKARLEDTQRAVLNILDDFDAEKARLEDTQRAVLNILDDFDAEKARLEDTQRAVLNILDDFDAEKARVDEANANLRREIAERRRAEEELQHKSAELVRSNADLEQFAYLASHDLQEPLRHVSAFVQKLADRYGDVLDDRGRTYIGFVVEGAERMRQLVNGLLEYSRVGRAEPHLRALDLGQVAADALRSLSEALADAAGQVDCDPSLPTVLADEGLLYRLLVNLVSNAVKFRHPERPLRVALSAADDGERWAVTVADNGVGIDAAYRERVFEMFERLHGQDVPGTGIGLSVARRIVEHHGGTIGIAGNPGGAIVTFTLGRPADQSEG